MAEESKELARRYYEAGDRDDLDAWDEICAPAMVLLPGFGEPIEGLEAVKQFTAGMHNALSDFSLTMHDVIAEGERVAVRWTSAGTHTNPMPTPGGMLPPSGKRLSLSGISIVRVADGKIVEERVQADMLGFMQQLGLIPAAEGASPR